MVLQVRQRRKRPYPITLAKANESLQRFYFFHLGSPRRPLLKSYGRSASAASDTTLIAAEFDFNFMGKSINSLLDDIDNSMCENTEKQELFQKIRYCNFTCIPFKRRGKKFVPDFSSM